MIEKSRLTLETIDKRLSNIEKVLYAIVNALEKQTSGKALNEEIVQLRKDVACLAEERTIFKQK